MPPLIDEIEGAIADQAQRAETQLGLHGPQKMRRQQAHEPHTSELSDTAARRCGNFF